MIRINWRDVLLNADNGYSVIRKGNSIAFEMVNKQGDCYIIPNGEIYITSPKVYGEEVTDKEREFKVLLAVALKIGFIEKQDTSVLDLRTYLENNISKIPKYSEPKIDIRVSRKLKDDFAAWCADNGTSTSDELRRYMTKMTKNN